jgi:transcriptional regulator with XRE-family HTH domain
VSSDVRQAKEALGARLREIRKDASLTGRALAERTGLHYSKVSRAEHGKQSLTDAQIRAWCEACGAPEQAQEVIALARSVETLYREWRRQARTGLGRLQESGVAVYEKTRHFRVYEHTILPGLLHTPAYAAALISNWLSFMGLPDDTESAVAGRTKRQRILTSGRHRVSFLLAEQTLRTHVGSAEVMMEQLGHVLAAATLPRVSVGVIPAMAERYAYSQTSFWIYDDTRATVETISARLEITRPDEIALYAATFDLLRQSAVYGAHAYALIKAARDDFRHVPGSS